MELHAGFQPDSSFVCYFFQPLNLNLISFYGSAFRQLQSLYLHNEIIDGHQSLLKHIINPMRVFFAQSSQGLCFSRALAIQKLFGHHMDDRLFVCR